MARQAESDQSRKDKDYDVSSLYIPKFLSADQATAVEAIFCRLAFSGSIAKNTLPSALTFGSNLHQTT